MNGHFRQARRDEREKADLPTAALRTVSVIVLILLCGSCGKRSPQAVVEIRGEPINSARPSNPPVQIAMTSVPLPTNSAPAGQKEGTEFMSVGFDKLSSYKFDPGEDLLNPQTNRVAGQLHSADELIPERVKAFDDKRVTIRGFMLPLKVEGGVVTEFLIMRDQSMCCYGVVPKINEWISVKMNGKGVKAIMDQPVTIYGTLHVGEMRENGYLVGIYRLDGQKMDVPEQ